MKGAKNILASVLVVFALLLVGFYIYRDVHRQSSDETLSTTATSSQNNNVSVGVEATGANNGYKVDVLSTETSATSSLSAILPNLDLPIVAKNKVNSEILAIITTNIKKISATLKKDPKNQLSWLNLAIFRKMLGDYGASRDIWLFVIKAWPDDYTAYNNLADLYEYYLKDALQSEKYWLKVIAMKPDYTQAYQDLSDLYRYSYPEKSSQAAPVLLRGIENNPQSLDLMVGLARYYAAQKDKINAQKSYQSAINEANREGKTDAANSLSGESQAL